MSEGGAQCGKKRGKQFYKKSVAKKRKKGLETLQVGMTGFLITCNRNEKFCVREAYNVLSEYADKIYGPEVMSEESSAAESDDDIEAALKKETQKLKAQNKKKNRRFQAVDSGALNVVFIKAKIPNPSEFAYEIFSDIAENKKKIVRHILRMIPVQGTCKAFPERMRNLCADLCNPVFHKAGTKRKTFSVEYKARYNNSHNKQEIIEMLAKEVTSKNSYHKVDLLCPDYTVICEVVKNVCCMSIVRDFRDLHRYNLHLVAGEAVTDTPNEALPDKAGKDKQTKADKKSSEASVGNFDPSICQSAYPLIVDPSQTLSGDAQGYVIADYQHKSVTESRVDVGDVDSQRPSLDAEDSVIDEKSIVDGLDLLSSVCKGLTPTDAKNRDSCNYNSQRLEETKHGHTDSDNSQRCGDKGHRHTRSDSSKRHGESGHRHTRSDSSQGREESEHRRTRSDSSKRREESGGSHPRRDDSQKPNQEKVPTNIDTAGQNANSEGNTCQKSEEVQNKEETSAQVEEDTEQTKKKSTEHLFKEDPIPSLPIWISDMIEEADDDS
ncbi:uncharacterized protein LOC144435227 [Glandiceps talaboti]